MGATFTIYLPCLEDVNPPVEVSKNDTIPAGRQESILFVDDEKVLVELAQVNLAELGYQVTACSDSQEALRIYRASPQKFDLIITDMTMPQISGSDLAREALKLRPDQAIIMCTGFSEYMDRDKASKLGIRIFLQKPISRRDIAVAIRKALGENPKGKFN
jgi:CheY-like chemotaxis protein